MPRDVSTPTESTRNERELADANRAFYEGLWSETKLLTPDLFSTWPLASKLAAAAPRRLEVAPGLRPRLPIEGTNFLDISAAALSQLAARGGKVTRGSILSLPFPDASFDLVAALDIIEHVHADEQALAELSRVAAPGATVLIATPLHPAIWNGFDDYVGHRRRYVPDELLAKLATVGWTIEQSSSYGMQAKSSRLLDVGIWFLTHRRRKAMFVYNHLIMPLGMRAERKKVLTMHEGLIDLNTIDEVLLVCRKS